MSNYGELKIYHDLDFGLVTVGVAGFRLSVGIELKCNTVEVFVLVLESTEDSLTIALPFVLLHVTGW